MAKISRDVAVECGGTFRESFVWKDQAGAPYDLTGFTAELVIKESQNRLAPPVLTLTHLAGITLGGVTGQIEYVITDEQTDAITLAAARYRLRLFKPDGEAVVFAKGVMTFEPS